MCIQKPPRDASNNWEIRAGSVDNVACAMPVSTLSDRPEGHKALIVETPVPTLTLPEPFAVRWYVVSWHITIAIAPITSPTRKTRYACRVNACNAVGSCVAL